MRGRSSANTRNCNCTRLTTHTVGAMIASGKTRRLPVCCGNADHADYTSACAPLKHTKYTKHTIAHTPTHTHNVQTRKSNHHPMHAENRKQLTDNDACTCVKVAKQREERTPTLPNNTVRYPIEGILVSTCSDTKMITDRIGCIVSWEHAQDI